MGTDLLLLFEGRIPLAFSGQSSVIRSVNSEFRYSVIILSISGLLGVDYVLDMM